MFKAVVSGFLQWLLSFISGRLWGSSNEREKQAEKAVEDYRKGERIDAKPDLPSDGSNSVFNWFKRVSK